MFPVSSESTERLFLGAVNNCVRGTMNTERHSNLVVCTENYFVKTIDQNKLVDNFGNKKIADIQFCCKF